MKDAPWLLGIIEALKCVALIRSSTFSTYKSIISHNVG